MVTSISLMCGRTTPNVRLTATTQHTQDCCYTLTLYAKSRAKCSNSVKISYPINHHTMTGTITTQACPHTAPINVLIFHLLFLNIVRVLIKRGASLRMQVNG